MRSKEDTLRQAGVKSWREMSLLLGKAQRKLGRGEPLTEQEQRVWDTAMDDTNAQPAIPFS